MALTLLRSPTLGPPLAGRARMTFLKGKPSHIGIQELRGVTPHKDSPVPLGFMTVSRQSQFAAVWLQTPGASEALPCWDGFF